MIQVTGHFKKFNKKIILVIDLEKDDFEKIKDYIVYNMFLAYRRIAPLFRGVILSSIGDNLDEDNKQNPEKAEVCIQVSIAESPTKEYVYLLNRETQWYVCCKHETEVLTFSIIKDSQFIHTRNYTDAG